jgi:uncharacterized protein YyaL (SSP411 family)
MAHESFENEEIAQKVNQNLLPIKLDREEHPEVDDAYMQAVLLANGHGGWPMTVFCLPTGEPFFAGTYFPPEDRGDRLGFGSLVERIAKLWRTQRPELEDAASQFAAALRESPRLEPAPVEDAYVRLLEALQGDFDPKHGGFGNAPKFPPHSAILFLQSVGQTQLVENTLRQMACGGIHDRVGGGFHRYSTDAEWRLPHFEKTLYDNALLLRQYSGPGGDPMVARGIVRWLEAEMRLPNSLYASALDADSDGEEGLFYTWRYDEVENADRFGSQPEGNFRDEATRQFTGQNVLLNVPVDDPSLIELHSRRNQRPRPARDNKAIVGWNALAISGLVAAGAHGVAQRVADALIPYVGSQLPHCIYGEKAFGAGNLEDHAFLGLALLDVQRPELAATIAQAAIGKFWDPEEGGFFSAAAAPFGQKKSWTDSPIPCANAAMATLLFRLGDLERAEATIRAGSGWMARMPLATEAMHEAAFRIFPPAVRWEDNVCVIRPPRGATVKIGDHEYSSETRIANFDAATYQVCRDGVCELPIATSRPSRS